MATRSHLRREASMSKHSPECNSLINQQAFANWWAKYPFHCTRCDARGYIDSSHDDDLRWEDAPSSAWTCDDSPCPACTDVATDADGDLCLCPRCEGQRLQVDGSQPCPDCGWNWGRGPDDCPPDVECNCIWDDGDPYPFPGGLYAPRAFVRSSLSGEPTEQDWIGGPF